MANKRWGKMTEQAEMLAESARSLTFEGMEQVDTERMKALAVAQANEMSQEMLKPLQDVSEKAGRMERESPLFFGTGDNPTLF